jgi:uncharacterized protein (DUF1800 family)
MDTSTMSPPTTIAKYTGPWTDVQAAHLLRRTTFGLSQERIDEIVGMGMEGAVDYLLRDIPMPNPPINRYDNTDQFTPIGQTWTDKPFTSNNQRNRSFASWAVDLMMSEGSHIREKLTIFWHNHFVVSAQQDARFTYDYSNTLRRNALGNFRTFVEEMTINPGMLRYLNGRQNTRFAPNENYGRELLELFTVGKGDLAGPGDYTTFTEEDVRAISRSLTGWRDGGHRRQDVGQIFSYYTQNRHDRDPKQLSHRFDNIVIGNDGEEEYKTVVDIVLTSPYVGRHIATKLYRYFVHYEIDEATEAALIEALGELFRDGDYEIRPMLRALLTSDAFYQDCVVGTMIRNPLDYIMHTVITMPMRLGSTRQRVYESQIDIVELVAVMQMELYNHPDVAGWKAYYQAPSYYRIWINSVTLPLRNALTDALLTGDQARGVGIDLVNFIRTLPDPFDVNHLITDIATLLFVKPISEDQLTALKEVLIPGLPDFEWTVEYTEYRNDEENFNLRQVIENKLRQLFTAMLRYPEYHLS